MSRVGSARPLGVALLLASVIGLGLRLYAATHVGFGDSEALYAAYALHPAPAYLDHPGLIGLLARFLGGGTAPSPAAAHRATAFLATAAPWGVVLAARALRAEWRGALAAGLATAVVPEVAVGLFGMTPDLLLFPAWVAVLGLAGAGLLAPPSSVRAAVCLVLAGLAAGIGVAAKASAAGLVVALVLTYLSPRARPHARTFWPWAGLALGALVVFPVVDFEAKAGWPMLHHRLVATQADAGLSLRNLGALIGGQLLYLSPVMAVGAALVAVDLWKTRRQDLATTLLANALVAPLALLVPLCLWSRVAEPHWVAPAMLALPLHYARRVTGGHPVLPRRIGALALGLGAGVSLFIHAWVLAPGLAAIVPASAYDGAVDISNELYGWRDVFDAVRELRQKHLPEAPDPSDVVVVGPHWVVCAQLEAALGALLPVGCASRDAADFAYWNPPERWQAAYLLVFVRDNRFPNDAPLRFPDRTRVDARTVEVRRGGRVARSFTVEVLARQGLGFAAFSEFRTFSPLALNLRETCTVPF
jgi:hypothetical protein